MFKDSEYTKICFLVSFGFAFAQEFSVPSKPNKKQLFATNAKVHGRNPSGYVGISSTIAVPLDGENHGVLNGVIAGKRKGDSFHYFENQDLGFVCKGTGKPAQSGGVIVNECFLNGASTGKKKVVVPNYGKLTGKLLFNVFDKGDLIGLAAMQWGLSFPNYKKLHKYLVKNGG
jgi:hypothetical protein